jgi:hypothetical protein
MSKNKVSNCRVLIEHQLRNFPKLEALYWIVRYFYFKLLMNFVFPLGLFYKNLNNWEMRFYSQNGEDGILQYIFAKIGTTNKYFVEFGVEDGTECNTKYLRQQGWKGLWMDGKHQDQLINKEWITAENIQVLLAKYKVPRSFDLLSIDIDSNDYWIWDAIKDFKPRVVVIEYNSCIPPDQSLTIDYDPKFESDGTSYFGASLLALKRLAKRKGYVLVSCDSRGINAFFVRKELAQGNFWHGSVQNLYRPPKFGTKKDGKYLGYPKSSKKMVVVSK